MKMKRKKKLYWNINIYKVYWYYNEYKMKNNKKKTQRKTGTENTEQNYIYKIYNKKKIKSNKKNMFHRNCLFGTGRWEMVENKMQENAFQKGRTLYEETQTRRMFALVAFSLHPPTTSIYVRTARQHKKYKKKTKLKMNLIIAMSKGEQEHRQKGRKCWRKEKLQLLNGYQGLGIIVNKKETWEILCCCWSQELHKNLVFTSSGDFFKYIAKIDFNLMFNEKLQQFSFI